MPRVFLALLILLLPLQAEENLLSNLRTGHPRLMLTPDRVQALKQTIASDPLAKRWHAQLVREAVLQLPTPPQTYTLANKKLLNESRAVLKRVSTLAALYQLKPDSRFADCAKKELTAAADFPDWNPASFLSTAEMTLAFALGYDWLHDTLTPEEKELFRTAIIEKGLKPGLTVYASNRGWPKATHNWNSVCNNGLIAGALAIADTDPEIAGKILAAAKESLPRGFVDYAPDGGWPEGPGYWGYGTSYAVYGLACLESALATDWGLTASPGFRQTADFRIDLIGPSGINFNFADSGSSPGSASCLFWLAKRFNRPDYDAAERIISSKRPFIFHLIFFNEKFSSPRAAETLAGRPLSRRFTGVDIAVLRSSHEKDATWLAIKGGNNKANHSNLDLGTFVLEVRGQRFAEELGADDYTLPGYFGKNRWDYYRTRTEGQNTLVISGENQLTHAKARITGFTDTSTTIDLTPGYPASEKIIRKVEILPDGGASIEDSIVLSKPAPVVWTMHTKAEATSEGKTATLTRGGITLRAEILSPASAVFTAAPVSIPEPQRQDDKLNKLTISIPADATENLIRVRFTPQP